MRDIASIVWREVNRDIKSVSHSVLVDEIVSLVDLLLSCLQIKSAQICLNLNVLSNRGDPRPMNHVC